MPRGIYERKPRANLEPIVSVRGHKRAPPVKTRRRRRAKAATVTPITPTTVVQPPDAGQQLIVLTIPLPSSTTLEQLARFARSAGLDLDIMLKSK